MPAGHRSHVACFVSPLNSPGRHGAALVEPVEHAEPAGQSEQSDASSRLRLPEYVPARHGSSAEAPGGQKLPALQTLHWVAPLSSWYVPPLQGVQVAWLADPVNVPGAHGAWAVEPVVQAEPAGHGVHSDASLRLGSFEKLPARHGS